MFEIKIDGPPASLTLAGLCSAPSATSTLAPPPQRRRENRLSLNPLEAEGRKVVKTG